MSDAHAPIAQLDRVTDYESVGRGFESLSAYHEKQVSLQIPAFFVVRRKDGLERTAPVRTLVQKLRAGEQFLVRGRVHGLRSAIRRIVNRDPFCFAQIPFTGICIFYLRRMGLEPFNCKAPVEPCLPPVLTAATPYFAPQAQRQRVPFGVCLQIPAFFRGTPKGWTRTLSAYHAHILRIRSHCYENGSYCGAGDQ